MAKNTKTNTANRRRMDAPRPKALQTEAEYYQECQLMDDDMLCHMYAMGEEGFISQLYYDVIWEETQRRANRAHAAQKQRRAWLLIPSSKAHTPTSGE